LTISEFCYRIRRKLVIFEHYIIMKKEIDINETKHPKEWFAMFVEWIKFLPEDDDD